MESGHAVFSWARGQAQPKVSQAAGKSPEKEKLRMSSPRRREKPLFVAAVQGLGRKGVLERRSVSEGRRMSVCRRLVPVSHAVI